MGMNAAPLWNTVSTNMLLWLRTCTRTISSCLHVRAGRRLRARCRQWTVGETWTSTCVTHRRSIIRRRSLPDWLSLDQRPLESRWVRDVTSSRLQPHETNGNRRPSGTTRIPRARGGSNTSTYGGRCVQWEARGLRRPHDSLGLRVSEIWHILSVIRRDMQFF